MMSAFSYEEVDTIIPGLAPRAEKGKERID